MSDYLDTLVKPGQLAFVCPPCDLLQIVQFSDMTEPELFPLISSFTLNHAQKHPGAQVVTNEKELDE